jgi:hypothetical protein
LTSLSSSLPSLYTQLQIPFSSTQILKKIKKKKKKKKEHKIPSLLTDKGLLQWSGLAELIDVLLP